jgi:hypothetical protein
MSILRISQPDNDQVVDVDSLASVEKIMRAGKPGRYDLDEISYDPLASGYTSRRWGAVTKHTDGRIVIEIAPLPSPS